jgi:hypothetical protein
LHGQGIKLMQFVAMTVLSYPTCALPSACMKRELGAQFGPHCEDVLREATHEHLAMLEQDLQRVMSYLQDRRVRYAAGDFMGPE